MKEKQIKRWIGFIFMLLFSFVAYLSITGKLSPSKDGDTYKVTAIFKDIGYLKKGANVTLGGVVVGHVKSLTLEHIKKQSLVKAVMLIKKDAIAIPADSTIAINTYGFFGTQYLSISPGFNPSNMKDGSRFEYVQDALDMQAVLRNLTALSKDTKQTKKGKNK